MYLGHVFGHCVVVESCFGPELFVALLALQGVLELQGEQAKRGDQITLRRAKSHTTHSRQQASLLCLSIKQRFVRNSIEFAIRVQFWSTHRVQEWENSINAQGSSFVFLFFLFFRFVSSSQYWFAGSGEWPAGNAVIPSLLNGWLSL